MNLKMTSRQFTKHVIEALQRHNQYHIVPDCTAIARDIRILRKAGVIGGIHETGRCAVFTDFDLYKFLIAYHLKLIFCCRNIDADCLVAVLTHFSHTRYLMCRRREEDFWQNFRDNLGNLRAQLETELASLLFKRNWQYRSRRNRFCTLRGIPRRMVLSSFQAQLKRIFPCPDFGKISMRQIQAIIRVYDVATNPHRSEKPFTRNDIYKVWIVLLFRHLFDSSSIASEWVQELYFPFGNSLAKLPLCCTIVHVPEEELAKFKRDALAKLILRIVIS